MFVHMALCLLFKKKCTMVRTKPERPDLAHARTPTCISIQITIPVRSVLKAADQEIASRKKIDASKLVHTDLGSYMTTMLLFLAMKFQPDGADVKTFPGSLMKKRLRARSSSVLRVVDITTVGRFQTDALMFVHTALCLRFKKKCTMVRMKPGRSELAHAKITTCTSIQITMPARSVLKAADQETAMRKKIDALKLAHTD